jgi:tRNA pseudouridine32 synthase / 23S rRNA pseudouridine746 synthase
MHEPSPYLVPHSSEEIAILYEDDDLLLVRKPDLLLSIPGRHPLDRIA